MARGKKAARERASVPGELGFSDGEARELDRQAAEEKESSTSVLTTMFRGMKLPPAALEIVDVLDEIAMMLIAKNSAYGDSALSPVRVFSRTDVVEQLKVRIDDKLSRLSRGHALRDESLDDTVDDLIGYLVLLKIANRRVRKVGARL